MYYYTDYNTFKLILTNGTLRFKESTSSNDRLDTIQLYNELITMAEDKLRDANLKAEQKFYFDMLKHNGVKSSRVSLVACFTTKADSRMLWDAYTMHGIITMMVSPDKNTKEVEIGQDVEKIPSKETGYSYKRENENRGSKYEGRRAARNEAFVELFNNGKVDRNIEVICVKGKMYSLNELFLNYSQVSGRLLEKSFWNEALSLIPEEFFFFVWCWHPKRAVRSS